MKLSYTSITLFAFVLTLLVGCTTYRTKNLEYETNLQNGNYQNALGSLDKNKFLKRSQNRLLYLFEKGKAAHLNQEWELSNQLFNEADNFIEDRKQDIKGAVLGVLVNPEHTLYRGEDFEKVSIHYYKALNYLFLGKPDDALVEAKRINLQLQRLNDKYPAGKKNRYTNDAFALNLQGMIFERLGNTNDAFISYRNAVNLYLEHEGSYFGVSIPEQLKKDLLRTASKMGFQDEKLRYEEKLGMKYKAEGKPEGGELILFWENGMAPFKDQTYYAFTILPGKNSGVATVVNKDLGINLEVPIDDDYNEGSKFSDIEVFNVAFPKYAERPSIYQEAVLENAGKTQVKFDLAQDYSSIAFKTLSDRMLREIGKAALRIAVKKIQEHAIREENENLGALAGLINAATERADTRNWQSLPGQIHYVRIPLRMGKNQFTLSFEGSGGTTLTKEVELNGNGGLQFQNIVTMQTQPVYTY